MFFAVYRIQKLSVKLLESLNLTQENSDDTITNNAPPVSTKFGDKLGIKLFMSFSNFKSPTFK